MGQPDPQHSATADAPALSARAMANLEFIRDTMASATAFTAVPGWGMAATGVTALGAAALASREPGGRAWLAIWLVEAVVGYLTNRRLVVAVAGNRNASLIG